MGVVLGGFLRCGLSIIMRMKRKNNVFNFLDNFWCRWAWQSQWRTRCLCPNTWYNCPKKKYWGGWLKNRRKQTTWRIADATTETTYFDKKATKPKKTYMESVANWQWKRFGRLLEPHFQFQNLPSFHRLQYELLTWENRQAFFRLFENDASPFVDERFKERNAFEEYADWMVNFSRFQRKKAACDWLIKNPDGTTVGVLHLHGLSTQDYDKELCCLVGFAIAESYFRLGYASEAVSHLLAHLSTWFCRRVVTAKTHPDNLASQALLRKTGFQRIDDLPIFELILPTSY